MRGLSSGRKLAILALVCVPFGLLACDLFLDADSLGNGGEQTTSGDAEAPDALDDQTVSPGDDGGLEDGPSSDAFLYGDSRPLPDGSIPKCVPPPPNGAEALGVTWAALATP